MNMMYDQLLLALYSSFVDKIFLMHFKKLHSLVSLDELQPDSILRLQSENGFGKVERNFRSVKRCDVIFGQNRSNTSFDLSYTEFHAQANARTLTKTQKCLK